MLAKQVALLRGINVGGKNKLPMKDLVAMFVAAGCDDVQNFIQSGNIIFRAPARISAKLPELIASEIASQFGYRTPVLLRTYEQLNNVIADNPFVEAEAEEKALFVMFLADLPSPSNVANLDADRSPPDRYKVLGKQIYLNLVNGAADTKLTNAYFDKQLATTSTARNWRTVNKLLELMKPCD
ncbi:MAG TPA: DUF1697 domain-containing protein [Gemmataceae bacterium]|jgi:uncharacterized protein (DUF1697 family)|nr:DUF1697 domain-containing protein [Gemmataceae bacterium]